jgi:pantothenate kinase
VGGDAAILPMDGYHCDDCVLIERGLRACKGAPETFDVCGLVAVLDRLRRNEEDEIAVPVFERDLEISRAAERIIPRAVRSVMVFASRQRRSRPRWKETIFPTGVTFNRGPGLSTS